MKEYETYIPPKFKECISKVVATENTVSWMIKKLLEYKIQPQIFKIDNKWHKND
jgi:hypothetical protein